MPGQTENFHRRPRPERVRLLVAKVTALAGGGVVRPDLDRGTAFGRDRSRQGLAGGGEGVPGIGVLSGMQQCSGRRAAPVDRADQYGEDGQAFAGAGVHAGLAAPYELAVADLVLADRTRHDPLRPAGRVLDRPLGEVEVEGPHAGQALAVGDPGTETVAL